MTPHGSRTARPRATGAERAGGYLPADLDALVAEVGASYPLLGSVLAPDEPYEEETALDPVIYAALLRP